MLIIFMSCSSCRNLSFLGTLSLAPQIKMASPCPRVFGWPLAPNASALTRSSSAMTLLWYGAAQITLIWLHIALPRITFYCIIGPIWVPHVGLAHDALEESSKLSLRWLWCQTDTSIGSQDLLLKNIFIDLGLWEICSSARLEVIREEHFICTALKWMELSEWFSPLIRRPCSFLSSWRTVFRGLLMTCTYRQFLRSITKSLIFLPKEQQLWKKIFKTLDWRWENERGQVVQFDAVAFLKVLRGQWLKKMRLKLLHAQQPRDRIDNKKKTYYS